MTKVIEGNFGANVDELTGEEREMAEGYLEMASENLEIAGVYKKSYTAILKVTLLATVDFLAESEEEAREIIQTKYDESAIGNIENLDLIRSDGKEVLKVGDWWINTEDIDETFVKVIG